MGASQARLCSVQEMGDQGAEGNRDTDPPGTRKRRQRGTAELPLESSDRRSRLARGGCGALVRGWPRGWQVSGPSITFQQYDLGTESEGSVLVVFSQERGGLRVKGLGAEMGWGPSGGQTCLESSGFYLLHSFTGACIFQE